MKRIVGLTGGIGSGKSTVAEELAARGATIVDADEIARGLTLAGGEAMPQVSAAFGPSFVAADGSLDRAAMRKQAFSDPAALARLEAILHPMIRARSDAAVERANGPYAVLVVPLLFEKGSYQGRVARTLVVDCPESLQVERVMARSGLAAEEVRAVMATQWPRWRRLQMADDVAWNGGDRAALANQCERLHRAYATIPRE
ncbi:dephospho-CoA kinase [Usitatibacter palustris]|uniref:Dephospho-CoA kinase n=1 Tax=Usitatibacter palustris TaxID=2732487 RepID=A0A6M4H4H7_9PROT|nr:dephospho-CoA kinase [Usitatibacter palustris]QJR13613.1 Dephospho-CoA kinase [Usitatibacter palustris]